MSYPKGKPQSAEAKAKNAEAQRTRYVAHPELREKVGAESRARWANDQQYRDKMTIGRLGHPVTAETRAKLRIAHLGVSLSSLHRSTLHVRKRVTEAVLAARARRLGLKQTGKTLHLKALAFSKREQAKELPHELALGAYLSSTGINDLLWQEPMGRYVVDWYSPLRRTVYEMDGYWGKSSRDRVRDAYLKTFFDIMVVHYKIADIPREFLDAVHV